MEKHMDRNMENNMEDASWEYKIPPLNPKP